MVFTVRVPPHRTPLSCSRRALLVGIAGTSFAGALSGCSALRTASEPPPAPVDPLAPLLAATAQLVERHQAVITAHPELADRLGPLHATHVAHVAALSKLVRPVDLAPASPPDSGASARPTTYWPETTRSADEAVSALRIAEQEAQTEAETACLAAPAERAPLLGSIAAARATHVWVLS